MTMFGFGGSKQSSQSSGSSWSRDRASSVSESGGSSLQGSESQTTSRVAFEDVFARLFGGAEGAAGGLDPSMLTDAANTLFSGGTNFMQALSGGGPEADFLASRLTDANPVVEDQIGLLSEDIGRLFREELNPAIESEAVAGGAFGGGRQGVAQGMAADSAAAQFARGAAQIRSDDISRRDAVAAGMSGDRIASAVAGFQGIPALAAMAEMGFSADLAPYAALADILGQQTTLTDSQATSFGTAADFARSVSESFGASASQQQSSSSGKSISLGFKE